MHDRMVFSPMVCLPNVLLKPCDSIERVCSLYRQLASCDVCLMYHLKSLDSLEEDCSLYTMCKQSILLLGGVYLMCTWSLSLGKNVKSSNFFLRWTSKEAYRLNDGLNGLRI